MPLMGPLEGKSLKIDTASQNMKFDVNSEKTVPRTLGVTPGWGCQKGLRLKTKIEIFDKPYQTSPHDLKSVLWFKSN